MADLKISQLTAADALDGDELVPVVQDGSTKRTTTQDIADLAAGGSTPAEVILTGSSPTLNPSLSNSFSWQLGNGVSQITISDGTDGKVIFLSVNKTGNANPVSIAGNVRVVDGGAIDLGNAGLANGESALIVLKWNVTLSVWIAARIPG